MHRLVLTRPQAAGRWLLGAAVLAVAGMGTSGSEPAAHGAAPMQEPGVLRGRLTVARPVPTQVRRPSLVEPATPLAESSPELQRGVVYLEVAPQPAFDDHPPARARLDQRNETFIPHVLAIRVGTVVDFPNNDRTYHNVFSLSPVRRFDLGRYASGRSRAVRFDRPGIVRVFCDIHSHMNAFILVFSHPYFAVTDADGGFDLGAVPAGTYRLAAWYDGSVRTTATVQVEAGRTTSAEVTIP